MNKDIKIILTDIGGVIFKSKGIKHAIDMFLEEEKEEKERKSNEIYKVFGQSFTSDLIETDFWNRISDITGFKPNKCKELLNCIEYKINYQYINKLKELSKKYKIGIVSDINESIYSLVKDKIEEFDNIFFKDYIFLSYKEKKSKYQDGSEFFSNILKKINEDPKRIVFIDDKDANILNALEKEIIVIKYDKTENEDIDNETIFRKIDLLLNG